MAISPVTGDIGLAYIYYIPFAYIYVAECSRFDNVWWHMLQKITMPHSSAAQEICMFDTLIVIHTYVVA